MGDVWNIRRLLLSTPLDLKDTAGKKRKEEEIILN